MNEPFGYSLSAWVSLCSSWLSQHANIPRGRVVISGTGYNDNVTGVGAASALSGTLLSLHFYGFWASDTTRAAWTTNLSNRLGSYSSRTIIDEAGWSAHRRHLLADPAERQRPRGEQRLRSRPDPLGLGPVTTLGRTP
jgi:hypothetical protein